MFQKTIIPITISKTSGQITPTVGVFAQYHVDGSIIGVEGGFSYWQKASQLVYNDNKELNYKVTPRYNYIGVSALLKIYPWRKGFNISIGGRAGANLNGKGISYESNQEDSKFATIICHCRRDGASDEGKVNGAARYCRWRWLWL